MRIEPLATERLLLRPLALADAPDLHRVYADAEAMRYWTTAPHTSVADTERTISESLSWPGGWWAIARRDDGRAIGTIGLFLNTNVPGIGYILGREHWRQGIGAEALRAVVDFAFNSLALDRAELWIHEDNIASQRLAQKVGFARRAQFRTKWPVYAQSHVMVVYGLRAADWPGLRRDLPPRVEFHSLEPILPVPDVRAAAEFYRDKLGFAIEFLYGDPPTHAGIARGEWSFPSARLQLTKAEAPAPGDARASVFVHVGPHIEQLRDAYRANGVEIVSDLERKPWGMLEFTVKDAYGYPLRFGTPT